MRAIRMNTNAIANGIYSGAHKSECVIYLLFIYILNVQ